jgi:hypothetical protein
MHSAFGARNVLFLAPLHSPQLRCVMRRRLRPALRLRLRYAQHLPKHRRLRMSLRYFLSSVCISVYQRFQSNFHSSFTALSFVMYFTLTSVGLPCTSIPFRRVGFGRSHRADLVCGIHKCIGIAEKGCNRPFRAPIFWRGWLFWVVSDIGLRA